MANLATTSVTVSWENHTLSLRDGFRELYLKRSDISGQTETPTLQDQFVLGFFGCKAPNGSMWDPKQVFYPFLMELLCCGRVTAIPTRFLPAFWKFIKELGIRGLSHPYQLIVERMEKPNSTPGSVLPKSSLQEILHPRSTDSHWTTSHAWTPRCWDVEEKVHPPPVLQESNSQLAPPLKSALLSFQNQTPKLANSSSGSTTNEDTDILFSTKCHQLLSAYLDTLLVCTDCERIAKPNKVSAKLTKVVDPGEKSATVKRESHNNVSVARAVTDDQYVKTRRIPVGKRELLSLIKTNRRKLPPEMIKTANSKAIGTVTRARISRRGGSQNVEQARRTETTSGSANPNRQRTPGSAMRMQCPHCDLDVFSRKGLRLHLLRKHSIKKQYACGQCAFRSFQRAKLSRHLLTKHNLRCTTLPGASSVKCHRCHIVFSDYDLFATHLHSGCTPHSPDV